jgi:DNA-directed RNA polymerase specialized sigma24 family protein
MEATMPNFDGTVDNRWRPDLESSQRRVREELDDVAIPSRELSFVPARRNTFEPYDARTRALIRRFAELERLPHGAEVSRLLSEWQWMDKMHAAPEKQRLLEPMIEAVRRDPERNEHLLIFLMLVFEPVRRSVSKAFIDAHTGIAPQPRDLNWSNREEARLIRHIEREQLYDVTREGAIEAVFRYPAPAPPRFFLWLRETIAHRALDKLRGELPQVETGAHLAEAEAEAMQMALAGFERAAEPPMRERRGMREWRARIHMRNVFDVVEEFFHHDPVREACRAAVGRLPRTQREVVNGYFFDEIDVPELAARRNVSASTVYNQKASAQRTLHDDDVFFSALHGLRRVRDQARAHRLARSYPDGRLPDGRRIVCIDHAA